MKPAAAAVAAILAVAVALGAAVLWTAGRNVLDEDRFADHTVAALASTPGRLSMTLRISGAVRLRAPQEITTPEIEEAVGRAVDTVAGSPAFAQILTPVAIAAHRRVVGEPGEPVEMDLSGLQGPLSEALAATDGRLAARLPSDGAFADVRISPGIEEPVVPGSALAGRLPAVTGLLVIAAAALGALALALSRRPEGTARRMASALILAAIVPAVIRLLAPRAAEAAVARPDDELARDLATRLLGAWVGPSVILLAAAAALLALGGLRGREGPPSRRRAA